MTDTNGSAPSPAESSEMRTLVVDYSRIGHSRTFRLVLLSDEREGISVGTHLRIAGDDVPDREAVVLGLVAETNEAELAFCD